MLKLWNLASRADLLDRRELLHVGGLSLAGLSLPALLQALRPRRRGDGRPAAVLARRRTASSSTSPAAPPSSTRSTPSPTPPTTSAASSRRSRPRVARRPLLRAGAAHREVDAQVGLVRTMCHDAQRPRPRLVLDVHRLSRIPARCRDVNSMSRADMPHMGSCVAKLGAGQGADVPVRHRAAPHGRGRRPPGRAVRRLARAASTTRC